MSNTVFYENKKKYNCRKNGIPYYRKSATINGKRIDFYGDGERDCLNKIDEAKKLAGTGVDLGLKSAKFGDVLATWLYNIKRVDRDLKASSFSRYECAFRTHIKPYDGLMNTPLSKLNSTILQMYLTDLYEEYSVSGSSIKNTFKVIKMFTKWAVNEGYLSKDPCPFVKLTGDRTKGKKKEVETFSKEERDVIYSYMDSTGYQYRELVKLGFATGMRLGEMFALKWPNVHRDHICVELSSGVVTHTDKNGNRTRYREEWDPKTENSIREIPITEETYAMLRELKQKQMIYLMSKGINKPSEYVFLTTALNPLEQSNFRESFRNMLGRAGVPYKKPHAMRHTFATEAIRAGVSVEVLQKLMGHGDIETTYQYVHASNKDKEDAIALMSSVLSFV